MAAEVANCDPRLQSVFRLEKHEMDDAAPHPVGHVHIPRHEITPRMFIGRAGRNTRMTSNTTGLAPLVPGQVRQGALPVRQPRGGIQPPRGRVQPQAGGIQQASGRIQPAKITLRQASGRLPDAC